MEVTQVQTVDQWSNLFIQYTDSELRSLIHALDILSHLPGLKQPLEATGLHTLSQLAYSELHNRPARRSQP